jgi:hypothetical protein
MLWIFFRNKSRLVCRKPEYKLLDFSRLLSVHLSLPRHKVDDSVTFLISDTLLLLLLQHIDDALQLLLAFLAVYVSYLADV